MKKLLIATDLGQLRAYRSEQDFDDPSPTIDLIQESDFLGRHHQFADRDTDQAGRFREGLSDGEQHAEVLESERVRMRQVADAVGMLAAAEGEVEIYLAAPKPVHRQLISLLSAAVRNRIRKSLELDLVKLPKRELLQRFGGIGS